MKNIYRLENQIKHYEWGSKEILPQFLDINNSKDIPYAEMWMGTHESAPSMTLNSGLKEISGELPFLLKLLAVEKPLSIQAHPDKEKAIAGFNRENDEGLSVKSPARNYRDKNHKNEIICAITPFTLMAGFREPSSVYASLEAFLSIAPQMSDAFNPLMRSLKNTKVKDSLGGFFHSLFNISKYDMEQLCSILLKKVEYETCIEMELSIEQWELMKTFASLYPADPAILSPLYLNLVFLQPFQAVFLPAGILHSYLRGFGLELMSNSDNVLRGGLTPKYIDINELTKVIKLDTYLPIVYTADFISEKSGYSVYNYPFEDEDFSLSVVKGNGAQISFPGAGPSICIVTEGELKTGGFDFKKGESFFVMKDRDDSVLLEGIFSLFIAAGKK
ncbi:MAG: mannose-6-phosphate isomerase, class I [Treponema sp.]|nr:mannose-6-phosphate isomerase, class I [Treponema sp.]